MRVCKGESKSEIKTRAKKIIAVLGGIFNYKSANNGCRPTLNNPVESSFFHLWLNFSR